jgi:molecular chaperone GrpE
MMQEKQAEEMREAELEKEVAAEAAAETGVPDGEPETTQPELVEPELTEAQVIEQLRQELAEAQAKAADYLDKLQRTAAEFQNSRRRLENQLNEETERANAALIKRLLPVLDDLDLAFQNAGGEAEPDEAGQDAWFDGFRQIQKKLLDILADQGVAVIGTDGQFDPMRHEAISSEPSESVESGHIIAPVRAGYEYKGRVLRPALVRVAT